MGPVRYPCCRHCKHVCICDPPCPGVCCPLPGGHLHECPKCEAALPLLSVLGRELAEFYAGMGMPG